MLDDEAIERLRTAADWPDLAGTKYRIVRRLASGGMGTIYAAVDEELDREVAVKVLSEPDSSGALSARLREEARHLARLEHPNIVPVHDAGRLADGRPFYVMKLVRGMSLDRWRLETTGLTARLGVFQKICEAVAFAHAHGVIHRDLKPENVMIGSFGEALVMDWGVAKRIAAAGAPEVRPATETVPSASRAAPSAAGDGAGAATVRGTLVGTPAYMAPEQARGDVERLDARTDVYALGAILYHLISGRPPHDGAGTGEVLARVRHGRPVPLRQLDASVPKRLASICSKAMAAHPAERYVSALQMSEDVGRFLDGKPVLAHPESLLEKAARLIQNNRTFILLILAYLVMRLVVLLATGR